MNFQTSRQAASGSAGEASIEDCIHTCNDLLREEVAMVRMYGRAIRATQRRPISEGLLKVQAAHERAVNLLRTKLLDVGGISWDQDCHWGEIAEEEANHLEEHDSDLSLEAFYLREERALERYMSILDREMRMLGCKGLIRAELLPLTRRSIDTLRALSAVERSSVSPFAFAHV